MARRHDRLAELAKKIEDDGGEALPLEADVTDHGKVEAFVAEIKGQLGGLHILVNNAGVMLLGPVDGADIEQWRQMVDVNLLGPPLLHARGAADHPRLRRRPHRQRLLGRGHAPPTSAAAVYNMTKWGVTGFSEALRQEALHSKIRVTCVEPGFVDTELQGHNEHPMVVEATEKMRERDRRRCSRPRTSPRRSSTRSTQPDARERQRDPDPPDGPAALDDIRRCT